jgi:hypothetical protein
MLLLHGGIQTIKVCKIRNIPLHPGCVFANLLDSSIQFWLPATSNIDIRTFRNETFRSGEANTAVTTCDDGNFSF